MNPAVDTVLAGAVWGVAQAIKMAGLPSRYVPLLALVVGVALVQLFGTGSVLEGLLVGLAAIGAHSGVTNSAE